MSRIVEVDKPRRDALGKMIFFNYDWINEQTGQCEYCLTDAQVQLIFTMLDYIGWQTRWESSTGTIDLDIIEQYKTDLAEALMNSCCDQPPLQYRFDPETGAYQVSTDGGTTWTDAPQYDPRETSTVNQPPSAFGFDTTKCQNADSMVKFIQQEMIDSIAADAAISAILGVVGTAILSLATGGTFLFFSGLLDAVVSGIFAFGIVAWQAAFTSTVIDDFRCAIFNNMDSDDSIDDAGVTALLAYINSHFTGIVVPTLYGYVNGMGRVGCTNAIRANRGDPDADCSSCEPCVGFDMSLWDTDQLTHNPGYGTIDPTTRTCNLVEIVAGLAGGTYRVQWQGVSAADCVYGLGHGAISGAYDTTQTYIKLCGTPIGDAYSIQNNNFNVQCVNSIILQSGSPFTVRITSDTAVAC